MPLVLQLKQQAKNTTAKHENYNFKNTMKTFVPLSLSVLCFKRSTPSITDGQAFSFPLISANMNFHKQRTYTQHKNIISNYLESAELLENELVVPQMLRQSQLQYLYKTYYNNFYHKKKSDNELTAGPAHTVITNLVSWSALQYQKNPKTMLQLLYLQIMSWDVLLHTNLSQCCHC